MKLNQSILMSWVWCGVLVWSVACGGSGETPGAAPNVSAVTSTDGGVPQSVSATAGSSSGSVTTTSGGSLVTGGATGIGGTTQGNTTGAVVPAGAVTFNPPSGTFSGSVSVELGTTAVGAEIRYTTDGTLPNAASPVYAGTAIQLTATTQLRAQPFAAGQAVGTGATGIYIARSVDITSDLPLIVLDSYGSGELDEDSRDHVDAAVLVFGIESGPASLAVPATLATRAGFHIRGQSSATFDKKPYRVEFWDELGEDRDLPVLGLPEEADWALIGPRVDETLIRHAFVYDLSRDMGMQAPRYAFAEFYLNVDGNALGAEDYEGVYMLVETIKNAKNRTNLQQLELGETSPELISGGYIFKFEYAAAEEPTLECIGDEDTCWADLEVFDPVPLDPAQGAWLQNHIQQFHDALHATTIADPTVGYPAFIDTPSFVDQFIINEFTKDVDAYVRSQYFHKDRGGLIFAGPIWDYNLSLGAGFDFGGINNLTTDGWMYPQRTEGVSDWFPILAENPEFLAQVTTRWAELRVGLFSEAQLNARVDAISAPLVAAAARNFELWGQPGGSSMPMGGGAQSIFTGPDAPTWEGQLEAMKVWMAARLAWLDAQWL